MIPRLMLAVGLLLALPGAAAEPEATSADAKPVAVEVPGRVNVRFQRLGIEHGLSQASARALAQDGDGFVWVGTQDGLNRYDGNEFRTFRHDPEDPDSLNDNHVTSLAVDGSGVLWVGTQSGGLASYDSERSRFQNYLPDARDPDSLAAVPVHALATDTRGWLWVGNGVGRLQRLGPDRQRFERVNGVVPETLGQIRTLLALPEGDMLVGSARGLWRYEQRTDRLRPWASALVGAGLDVYALARDVDGAIWVGTDQRGVIRIDAKGYVTHRYNVASGLAGNDVRALLTDSRGALWVGAYTGLSRIERAGAPARSWHREPSRSDALASDRVHALLEDRDGLVWIGTWLEGVNIFTPASEAFTELRGDPGNPRALPGSAVRSVHADRNGRLWLGVLEGGGLVEADPDIGVLRRFVPVPGEPGSLALERVQAIASDLDGNLWVGTAGAGLDRLRPGAREFDHFPYVPLEETSPGGSEVLSLYVDRTGTLWIGYQDSGMDALCRGCSKFNRYRYIAGNSATLPGNSIGAVFESSQGELWVGARPGGLSRLDRGTNRFEPLSSLLEAGTQVNTRAITCITESRRGDLWLGTQGDGAVRLERLPDGRFRAKAYTHKNGLAAEAIGSIIEAEDGRMWLSTTLGMSRVDPDSDHIENFSGRSGAQITGYFVNAGARLPDGRLAFGGLRGLTVFHPEQVATRGQVRAPTITSFRTYVAASSREAASWSFEKADIDGGDDQLRVAAGAGGFGVTFSAMAFSDSDLVQYSYRLDPIDADWIEAGPRQRSASYPHLPPGQYTLRLRARFPGDEFSPERRLAVEMGALWWQTTAARIGYVLFALAVLAALAWALRQRLAERARAERVLTQSEERLKLALWGTGDELWDLDLVHDRLRRQNPLRHLRASGVDVVERAVELRKFVHPDDLPDFDHAMSEHLSGKAEYVDASYRVLSINDEWRWIRTRGRVVSRDVHGRATRLVGTSGDITHLKEHEEALARMNSELEERVQRRTMALRDSNANLQHTIDELRQTQKQLVDSEKMAALGGLVAGVAHEINTPLGIGVTASSHLEEETKKLGAQLESGTLSREALDHFRQVALESSQLILRNLLRADKLVRSFKQVAVDQANEEARVINLQAYLEEVLTSLQPTLKKNRHKVSLDCPDQLLFKTYPGSIYQIVANLVMNSLLHGFRDREGGQIRISARRDGEVVRIDYEDDGVGMSEEVRRRIFEPFFTTRRGEGGSGLGMHIVWNLSTQVLKGSIECDSTPGNGVRFRLTIPVGAA